LNNFPIGTKYIRDRHTGNNWRNSPPHEISNLQYILLGAVSFRSKFYPIGTAFSIGPKYAVTAFHNLFSEPKKSQKLYNRLVLCKIIFSDGSAASSIPVVLTTHCSPVDNWAVLSPQDPSFNFPQSLVLCRFDQLPGSDERVNKSIRTIFAPCGMYLAGGSPVLELVCEHYCPINSYRPDIVATKTKASKQRNA